MKHRQAGTTAV